MKKRSSPNIKNRKCEMCGLEYKPKGTTQKYCDKCKIIAKNNSNMKWYSKNNPNHKPKSSAIKKSCCVCGEKFSSSFKGKDYCNKHWQRVKKHGDPNFKVLSRNKFKTIGDITEVLTTKGDIFIIDTEDIEKVNKNTWCKNKSGGYLVSNINGKIKRLHRHILNCENDNVVDHINGDVNDNRKINLRICSQKENSRNSKSSKAGKICGVNKMNDGRYKATIMVDRKGISLGVYDTYDEACKARLLAEEKYYKEFSPILSRNLKK